MLIKEMINIALLILIAILTLISYKMNLAERKLSIITLILVAVSLILYLV